MSLPRDSLMIQQAVARASRNHNVAANDVWLAVDDLVRKFDLATECEIVEALDHLCVNHRASFEMAQ